MPFELRYALHGRAAVRVHAPRGPVAARHVEPPDVTAPWIATARCGDAAGWLLAGAAPVGGADRARAALRSVVDRHTALELQQLETARAAFAADLLEALTHRLRTDVSTLQAVAEGALAGIFTPDELEQIPAELKSAGGEAQRRLSQAREVMGALHPEAPWRAEPVAGALEAELEGAGAALRVLGVNGEVPLALGRGTGWSACARLLAAALARDTRLGGEQAVVDGGRRSRRLGRHRGLRGRGGPGRLDRQGPRRARPYRAHRGRRGWVGDRLPRRRRVPARAPRAARRAAG